MEAGAEFSHVIEAPVRHFNGGLFQDTTVFHLGKEAIGELLAAARADWKQVDPAIFGTLLEQALDKTERKRLGAHYTPRAYVQRLVEVTVMAPLRADWQAALTRAEQAKEDGKGEAAIALVRAFHHQLCATRVLDPACGTGNFLYVALELMKKLEGDVLQTLGDLGDAQASFALIGESIDPHQFLGLELNPRAAAIAELVIWIGYLQWHYRNYTSHPNEPILKAFHNINFGRREGYDAVLTWDGYPVPGVELKDGKRIESYPNARRPEWPEAEFIVGNPPFIGGKDIRAQQGDGYAEALWKANPAMNDSADLVIYWWDRAADILTRKGSKLKRFGLVTTNSITQVFQRRTVARWLGGANPNKQPLSLIFAIDDHPWTKATKDAAAVRIAMTVARAGASEGELLSVTGEAALDTDEPRIDLSILKGVINADLTVGVDVTGAGPLAANQGVCSPGVKLHGAGFIVSPAEAAHLGLGRVDRPGLKQRIRPYRNGRDLLGNSRGAMVIDLDGMSLVEVRSRYPEVYQHLLLTVKPERDQNNEAYRRENWWLFGRRNTIMRGAIGGLPRYITTSETAKHRIFEFLDRSILPDNRLVCFGFSGGEFLAILSSRVHVEWTLKSGGTLEDRPIYTKSRCFDPFPFPSWTDDRRAALAKAGESLDAFRKARLAEWPDLTLTRLYNALEAHRAGGSMTAQEAIDFEAGSVMILAELHEAIDALTAEAYGWPADLADEEILERLVALNADRAKEEAAGHVRWLRPDYQILRFAKPSAARSGDLALGEAVVAIDAGLPAFPADRYEQPLAVEALLAAADRPMTAAELARGFRRGGKRIERRVTQVLTTLARYGRVSQSPNGAFTARRAA